ncbi:MAG TPA: hypothetical protein PLI15_11475 [Anaerolineales bacterium]|nr:hypothetical protein [Anaerolineales bacterium]HNC89811.1 hypothetical protein [Anaerolineales bacterium]
MPADTRISRQARLSILGTAVLVISLSGLSFFIEIKLVWQLVISWGYVYILRAADAVYVSPEASLASSMLFANISVFVLIFFVVLFWVSPFILPVRGLVQTQKAFTGLIRSLAGKKWHGPAIFVKEGKPNMEEHELDSHKAGVALVDLYSAIVLEQQTGSIDSLRQEVHFEAEEEDVQGLQRPGMWKQITAKLGVAGKNVNVTFVKAFGPGVVFTESGEKIVGFVDLRKQSRSVQGVKACTRDGIEITTNVNVTFTLGQAEDILKVTRTDLGWRAVQITAPSAEDLVDRPEPRPGDQVVKFQPVDTINEQDMNELEHAFTEKEFEWSDTDIRIVKVGAASQFVFEKERVFSAVYSRARSATGESQLIDWTELPGYVAADIFREQLAHENYDDLYKPEEPNEFPMGDFKRKFGRMVTNQGMLGYQVVMLADETPIKDAQFVNEADLKFSPPLRFKGPAILRDRGIKVLSAGFGDLVPVNEDVRAQLFENWRAHWQQEAQKTLANHELRAMRIHNHERSRTQQDMIYSLSRIFHENQYTEEALALRLYQALEAAAINPATQRLLPADTVQMLSNLRHWLLPENKKSDESNPVIGEEGTP